MTTEPPWSHVLFKRLGRRVAIFYPSFLSVILLNLCTSGEKRKHNKAVNYLNLWATGLLTESQQCCGVTAFCFLLSCSASDWTNLSIVSEFNILHAVFQPLPSTHDSEQPRRLLSTEPFALTEKFNALCFWNYASNLIFVLHNRCEGYVPCLHFVMMLWFPVTNSVQLDIVSAQNRPVPKWSSSTPKKIRLKHYKLKTCSAVIEDEAKFSSSLLLINCLQIIWPSLGVRLLNFKWCLPVEMLIILCLKFTCWQGCRGRRGMFYANMSRDGGFLLPNWCCDLRFLDSLLSLGSSATWHQTSFRLICTKCIGLYPSACWFEDVHVHGRCFWVHEVYLCV